ncbi:hypothetical protein G6011_00998 [Alternaria panax]|uniref:Myb-like domain-containing protein n=1 Tax=Alternaria panax TaxID=48097 RepID=A0AAD4NV75_9PLEO|nr:hypothetical protein G6011_00998 [Alternaria panax]
MPPKKVAGDSADAGGKFSWTAENDRTLLVLTMGRALTTEDFHKLAKDALPPGTNWNAVRQRVSKMRVEQRKRFEDLGWAMPESAAKTPTKTPKGTPKKRAAATDKNDEGGDAETESPTKKPRARRPKKETVKKEIEDEGMAGGDMKDEGVKEKEFVEAEPFL